MRAPDLTVAREQSALILATVVEPDQPKAADVEAPDDVEQVESEKIELAQALDREALEQAAFLLITLGAQCAAKHFGPQWMVNEERAQRIAKPLVKVALKYCPALEGNGPELELGIALGDYALAGIAATLEDKGREVIATATVTKSEPGEASEQTQVDALAERVRAEAQ